MNILTCIIITPDQIFSLYYDCHHIAYYAEKGIKYHNVIIIIIS